jgi:50S ribosomal subunit-associated GTPase HflX
MRELSIREGTAFILVFDLSNESTLKSLLSLFEKIKEIKIKNGKSDKVPLILVGNKNDLVEFDSKEKRILDEAKSIACGIFKCSFVEVSAKCSSRDEISKIFTSIAELILNKEIEDQFNSSKSKSRRGSSVSTGRRISILKFESLNYGQQSISRRFSEPLSIDMNCLVEIGNKKPSKSFRATSSNVKNYKNCIIS